MVVTNPLVRRSSPPPTASAQRPLHTLKTLRASTQERGANARTQFNALMTCVHAARFLFHGESKVGVSD